MKSITLSDLPADYIRIVSGVGEATPRFVVAAPIQSRNRVLAVVEVASFGAPTELTRTLLDEVTNVAGLDLEILQRNLKTRELLDRTQRQAEELQAQQESLRAREEQFRTLVEAIPDALIISDQDGRIRLINDQTEQLFGYRREELVGQQVELLVPERIRAAHPSLRRRFFEDPSVRAMGVGLELTAVGKDGTEFPVEISLSPLPEPNGRGILVCSSLRDISERKRLEREVRASEERNRLILESSSEGIFGVDCTGSITFVNPSATRILGYSAEELIGQRSHALIHDRRADGSPYPMEDCPMFAAYTRGEASRIDDECLCRCQKISWTIQSSIATLAEWEN
jgi:two-component system, sensor histidine kinase and response regulator